VIFYTIKYLQIFLPNETPPPSPLCFAVLGLKEKGKLFWKGKRFVLSLKNLKHLLKREAMKNL